MQSHTLFFCLQNYIYSTITNTQKKLSTEKAVIILSLSSIPKCASHDTYTLRHTQTRNQSLKSDWNTAAFWVHVGVWYTHISVSTSAERLSCWVANKRRGEAKKEEKQSQKKTKKRARERERRRQNAMSPDMFAESHQHVLETNAHTQHSHTMYHCCCCHFFPSLNLGPKTCHWHALYITNEKKQQEMDCEKKNKS